MPTQTHPGVSPQAPLNIPGVSHEALRGVPRSPQGCPPRHPKKLKKLRKSGRKRPARLDARRRSGLKTKKHQPKTQTQPKPKTIPNPSETTR